MIYLTGDIHGDLKRFRKDSFSEQLDMTKDDYVIILGDFGLIWDQEESEDEKYHLDILEKKSYTTLFVDGNHENHDRLNSYPMMDWHGGKVHKIRPSVLHLMRAQIFSIEGMSFFTFGGAASHDIEGCASKAEREKDYTAGVLRRDDPQFAEKARRCRKNFLNYRVEGETWWRSEMPTEEEMEAGRKKLDSVGWNVDYVLTHECPSSTLDGFSDGAFLPDKLTEYFEEIKQKLSYKEWYSGHHHDDIAVSEKDIVLYCRMHRLV